MAILASRAGMELHVEDKSVHPFFEKRLKTRNDSSTPAHDTDPTIPLANQSTVVRSEDVSPVGQGRRSWSSKGRPPATPPVDSRTNAHSIQTKLHALPQLLGIDPNHGRRKRVKSMSPEVDQLGIVAESGAMNLDHSAVNSRTQPAPTSSRVLRLNPKTGTIGSPPAKKTTKMSPRAGGKGVSVKTAKYAQCLVTMKYGRDAERRSWLGQKINDISNGVQLLSAISKPPRTCNERTRTKISSKSTHPFFLGQKNLRPSTPNAEKENTGGVVGEPKRSPQKKMMTLGEARTHSPRKGTLQGTNSSAFRNFGKTVTTIKYPGAVEPCWPPKGMGHVRGLDEIAPFSQKKSHHIPFLAERKSKYASMEIPGAEEILKIVANNLGIADVLKNLKGTDGDGFPEPKKCLRVPAKHFESGLQVQRRVRREILTNLPSHAKHDNLVPSEDELQEEEIAYSRVHVALLKIYGLIPNQLTAFDRSEYEIQSWVHKYAPCTASDVLQCGKEAFILKDWLHALTVVSVDRGGIESGQIRAGSAASRRSTIGKEKPGKKKRRSDHLRGFVVSSDDDLDELDEISDPEAEFSMHEGNKPPIKTVLRSRDLQSSRDARKVRNAVIISGPSGCGKTAMVYAVAKELRFEVFEINSSSRRSGKEIMERVGDMTRNHLVQHSHNPNLSGVQSEDIAIVSDTLEAELKSGRQGTMNSFFKPKRAADSVGEASRSSKASKKSSENGPEKPLKPSPKKQKQSLILLEEVDVLFEEDKQFWTTVLSLIAQSKRPVIMTCNDEALVPLQNLPLHAIIRPTPPPSDVATDYMLLVAAAEGHLVPRKAVKTLYEARGHDLRASMAELDYWCQLGVGDCKGGLDWFYPRWPPGCDVDEKGNTIRVMSEGTYKTGMGWLGRDFTFERFNDLEVKEEVLRQAWDGWNIYMDEYKPCADAASFYSEVSSQDRLKRINSFENFSASMSLADVCAAGSLAAGNQTLLDKTSPPMPARSRDDFVIGYELLEADILNYFDPLHQKIALWIQSQAKDLLHSGNPLKRQPILESQITTIIANAGSKQGDLVTRKNFCVAFDPIAEPEKNSLHSASLECSVFDRTTSIIAEDVAPYVRSIVAYDAKLQQERARLSNLLSEGGRKGKRLRTTRSALSALEGGPRKNTRAEKYFRVPLNAHLVRNTGMQCWEDAVASEMQMRDNSAQIRRDESEDASGMTDSS